MHAKKNECKYSNDDNCEFHYWLTSEADTCVWSSHLGEITNCKYFKKEVYCPHYQEIKSNKRKEGERRRKKPEQGLIAKLVTHIFS